MESVHPTYCFFANPITGHWDPFAGSNPTPPPSSSVLPALARTATIQTADMINTSARGGHFIINVTALTAGASLVPTILGKDSVNGVYYTLLTGNAITATGITVLKIYPGIVGIANAAAVDILPATYAFLMTAANADSVTYSVAFNGMP